MSQKLFGAAKLLTKPAVRFASTQPAKAAFPNALRNVPETRVTTLPNGLRVATEDGHGETATVGVWIDAGSRYETEKNNGVAHFLEHLTFKGTDKRTQGGLEVEIENMGAHLNAYTSREQTVYYFKVFKNDVGKAVDILADILQKSKLPETAIENERGVILREMEEVESQVEEVIFDQLHATAFQGSSLGRTILGPKENIKSISRKDLLDYIGTHYTAPRMVIAGAGAIKHEELVRLAEQSFGGVPKAPATPYVKEPSRFIGSDVRIYNDDLPSAHIALAVEGAGWQNPDSIALMVLQSHLGAWDRTSGSGKNVASHLCRKIATEDLATSVMSFNTSYSDTGLFGVYAVGKPESIDDLVYEIQHELVRVCFKITEEEVELAKKQLKTSLLMNLDGSTNVADDIGRQLLVYGRRMNAAEIFARIDAIDAETIKQVGQKYIYDRDVAVAAIGNLDNLPDYNKLRRWTYWVRY
eukprot:TRINITY_DN600_c0_g1_i1.p1 TRINITY_DN600_c0_g1~~TRINITY_DN600_c0_g1_i1.p1  ORF type:complete len:470 (-),score=265.00 TRINITY_DN600_c0_g1_i1:48-1457(-)